MSLKKIFIILFTVLAVGIFSNEPSIVPDSFLREWDPITVFFNEDIGPEEGGSLDEPGDLLKIEPDHPGEYRWVDSRTIQFNPTIPWPSLKRYKISSLENTEHITTMMVQPNNITPSNGSKGLNPVDNITLKFSSQVDIKDLEKIITVIVKPLPGIGGEDTVVLNSKDFVVSKVESSSRDYLFSIKLNKSIGYGKSVLVKLALSLDSSIEGSTAIYRFSTKDDFRIISMGSGYTSYPVSNNGSEYSKSQAINCGTGTSPLFIDFSESLASLSIEDVKKLVSFEPSVLNLSFSQSGGRLYLRFNVDKETPYKITINKHKVKSRSGRELAVDGKSSMFFYYKNLSPYIKWKKGQVLTERFGPKFFPMEGRATNSVDLRVYRIEADDERFWPYPKSPVDVSESNIPLMPGEDESASSIEDHIKLLEAPIVSEVVDLPISENSGKTAFGLDLDEHFTKISGKNNPGTYLVGYRTLGSSKNRSYVKVVVTDLSLTTVEEEKAVNFIVTSLDSGKKIAGAKVDLEAKLYDDQENKWVWNRLVTGYTNSGGQFRFEHEHSLSKSPERIRITKGDDVLLLNTDTPPPSFSGNHWYNRNGNWLGWLSSRVNDTKSVGKVKGYIFTERPVYRPDEPVHIMGYIRYREKGLIKKDNTKDNEKVLKIWGPGSKNWEYPLKMEGNDQFYHLFDEEDLPTGEYYASVYIKKTGEFLSEVFFKKEAYRVPRFEIDIKGDTRVPADKPFDVELIADFYAGGRVIGQRVNWNVTKYPYFASSATYPGFNFAVDERFTGYSRYTSIGSSYDSGITDENGSAKLTLNPASENGVTALRYVIEATVRGADSQTVSDTKEVIALPPFSLGVKLDKFINDRENVEPEIILLDFDDKPIEGRKVTVRLFKREWHSYLTETDFTTGEAKYISDVVDKKVFEKEIATIKDNSTKLKLDIDESGVYIVEVLAYDDLGRLQRVKNDFFVPGETPTTWEKTHSNVFNTILNKKKYNPGDTISMLLKSPYQNANALVVAETPTGNLYNWVEIKNGQGIFTMDITEDLVPGFPVHTLIMRGRTPGTNPKSLIDRGKPVSMGNTTWIDVNPESNELKLKLEHNEVALPGSDFEIDINLEDSYGNKMDGDVMLWLVDRAVLALGNEKKLAPLDAFIDPVYSYISIKDIRNTVVGNLPVEEIQGGDGEMEESMAAKELLDNKTVRKNFKTVAYHNKRIRVKNGKAKVKFKLPDNLTDFAIRAVAVSGFDKFGSAKSKMSIRLPVIIQSAMPRFVRPGDNLLAGGIGRVVEGIEGKGVVQIESDYLSLGGENSYSEIINLSRVPGKLYYPIKVPDDIHGVDDIKVRMAIERSSDKAGDAFEMDLPVSYLNIKGAEDSLYTLNEGDKLKFPFPSQGVKKGSVTQTAYISTNESIIRMMKGLNVLETYPHGCLEQRISQLYPKLALDNLFNSLDIPLKYGFDPNKVNGFLQYADAVQDTNGLFSFWPGSGAYVGLTAYTLEFLSLLDKNGFNVSDEMMNKCIKALKSSLRTDSKYLISEFSLRERIDALAALSSVGEFDRNYASDILDAALNSDLYNKARMVQVYYENGRDDDSRIKKLVEQLWSATSFKKINSQKVFAGLSYNTSWWGGPVISSQVDTLSHVIRALNDAEPNSKNLTLMVDYLVKQGDTNGWGNTKNSASALLAIQETISSEFKKVKSTVTVNDIKLDIKNSLNVKSINSDDRAIISYSKGDEPLYVWLNTTYHIDENVRNLREESKGFLISSEFIMVSKTNEKIGTEKITRSKILELSRDDIVEANIQVTNAEDSYYVAITIPLAAGFDPLNPELLTSPPEAEPFGTLTLEPSYTMYLDDKVVYYYDYLPKGMYNFYFRLRATTAGDFFLPPAYVERMYEMSYRGMSNAGSVLIEEE